MKNHFVDNGNFILVHGLRFYRHHSALERGYQTVKHDSLIPYDGKFGYGFKRYTHNPKSTQYVIITYYVLDEH